MTETWRAVFREGFAPVLPLDGLRALREALLHNDPAVRPGSTTVPAFEGEVEHDERPTACCPVAYCGWKPDGLETIGEVSDFFNEACSAAEYRLKEVGASRHLVNWIDDAPWPEVRAGLLAEVERELDRRQPPVPRA